MNKKTILQSAGAALLLWSFPILSGAQTTVEDDEDYRLELITVSATRTAQLLHEVPMSVSVIDGSRIDKANSFNGGEDLVELLTGVQAAVANGTQVAFQIRGIGAVDHQALTPSAAAVYLDDVFLATNVQTGLMLYDIDRVEVLKGPQGALFGRNASSGAINFQTARPSADQSSYVDLAYGNHNRIDAKGAYGVSLSDNVHFRLAGRYLSEDPTLDNVQTNPAIPRGSNDVGGVRDEFGLRASLAFDSGSSNTLLRLHYEEDNGINATPRNSSLSVDDHEISSEGDGVQDTDNEFYGAALEYRRPVGEWELYSLTAAEGYNQQYGFDFDGTPAPFGVPSLNANLSYDRDFLQLSEELRIEKSRDGGRTLIGLHAAHEDFSQVYTIWCGELDPATLLGTCRYVGAPGRAGPNAPAGLTATTLITEINQTRLTGALFTWNTFDLTDRLTATLGARWTYEEIEGDGQGIHIFNDGTRALNNRGGLGLARGENTIEDDRLTGNLALYYEIPNEGSAYISYANGYKSGGFNGEVQNNATHFSDEGLFGAETVDAFELGFKSENWGDVIWSAAAFYQAYDAPQARIFVNFPLPDGTSITSNSLSNLDEARSLGLEVDVTWSPSEDTYIHGGVTLLDTEIDQSTDIGGNSGLFDGNPLPFASEVSVVLDARKTFELGDNRRLVLDANSKYRSDYYLDAEGLAERSQDGFTTINASAAIQFVNSGLELSVWGRNLTDQDYAVSGFGFIGYNTFRSQPASYGVRLRWEQ